MEKKQKDIMGNGKEMKRCHEKRSDIMANGNMSWEMEKK